MQFFALVSRLPRPAALTFLPRVLGAAGMALMLWLGNGAADDADRALLAAVVLWPGAALLVDRLRRWISQYAEALLGGIAIATLEFSLLPAAAILVVIVSSHLAYGGALLALRSASFAALGATTLSVVGGVAFDPIGDAMAASAAGGVLLAHVVLLLGMARIRASRARSDNQAAAARNADLEATTSRLARYIAPQVSAAVVDPQTLVEAPRRRYLTVFFSDIQGFTEITESLEPEHLSELLNDYLATMSEVALRHGGTIDKFVGDAVMVFFGDPQSRGAAADAAAAAAMALEMQNAIRGLAPAWVAAAGEPLAVRMGMASGYCMVGSFGCAHRMDYTVVGGVLNLASRLEHRARPGEVLVAAATAELLGGAYACSDRGSLQVRGLQRPVPVYAVTGEYASRPWRSYSAPGVTLELDTEEVVPREAARVLREALVMLEQQERRAFGQPAGVLRS